MSEHSRITLDRYGLMMDGRYQIPLCASLFYFRIPAGCWLDRIRKLKRAGYSCADVYFPWNHHELSPGEWSFEGERDVDAFLRLMAQEGMQVVARPGPYICSEWDGGAIPAWLLTDGKPIRSADPEWMRPVAAWYDHILPCIVRHQVDQGGSVILLQVENELDFFDCPDPRAYQSELAAMARRHGIRVPIFGCAGQGSVQGATGYAPDVLPTFNFYPDVTDASFDSVCLAVHEALAEREMPLFITETGREHFLLRRELANGARFLGAYNQVGGTNFGFSSSINNWGKGDSPLSFLTTDYDFQSMVDAAGCYRPEVLEGRLLGGLLDALGNRLACATVRKQHGLRVRWEEASSHMDDAGVLSDMGIDGALLCLPNFTERTQRAEVSVDVGERTNRAISFRAVIGTGQAPFLPVGLNLSHAGFPELRIYSGFELLHLNEGDLVLYGEPTATAMILSDDLQFIREFAQGEHAVAFQGRRLRLRILDRVQAACLDVGRGELTLSEIPGFAKHRTVGLVDLPQQPSDTRLNHPAPAEVSHDDRSFALPAIRARLLDPELPHFAVRSTRNGLGMEALGMWRGTVEYRVNAAGDKGLLLEQVADMLQTWQGTTYLETRVCAGQWVALPSGGSEKEGSPVAWRMRVAAWGHSNFDDARLPALRIASEKGIHGIYQVDAVHRLNGGWRFRQEETWLPESLRPVNDPLSPLLSPNAWNSTRMPLLATYSTQWVLPVGCTACALHLDGMQAETAVYVNDAYVCVLLPGSPWVNLSKWLKPDEQAELALHVRKRDWSEPVGTPCLYHLTKLSPSVWGCSEMDLTQHFSLLSHLAEEGEAVEPAGFALSAGQTMLLSMPMDGVPAGCSRMRITGREIMVTALLDGHVLGRLFLPSASRLAMVGGDPELLYLPGPWRIANNSKLLLLVEALSGGACVETVVLQGVQA